METRQWTQLWLEYRKVKKKYNIQSVVLTGFSKENPVIQNAVKRTGKRLSRSFGRRLAGD